MLASAVLHLIWESGQLPLYAIWSTGSFGEMAFAVAHCTIGDAMIAASALLSALALFGRPCWPKTATRAVWLVTLLLGIAYTVYSEWLNVNVRRSWAYSELMPTVPIIGTGVAPLLQWIALPTLVQWLAIARAPWIDVEQGSRPPPLDTG